MTGKSGNKIEINAIIEAVKNSNTELIFGKEVEKGDKTIIPIGRVQAGFGFGYGGGSDGDEDKEEGYGGGGGFGMKVEPVGYIEVTEDSTKLIRLPEFSALSAITGSLIGIGIYKCIVSKRKKKTIIDCLRRYFK